MTVAELLVYLQALPAGAPVKAIYDCGAADPEVLSVEVNDEGQVELRCD